MPRSLRVQSALVEKVKLSLRRNGFPSQRSLAEDVGLALATVSNFLTGKPVDYCNFEELCRRLALDWREVADLNFETPAPSQDEESPVFDPGEAEPDTSPIYPSGAVPLGSPYYLERVPVEGQVYREMKRPGALVRIKAPREMGKTSLLLRALDYTKQLGYRTVSLNLEQVDQAILKDLNQFSRWLCANVTRQLQLKSKLDEYWDDDLGSKISCTAYFQDYLLQSIPTPIVLAFDEVNQLFEHPQVAKDFLPLLRSWYEEAKTLPIWQKLRLIVVYSTEIYVPLQLNQSPFNVGLPIQLSPFSKDEVKRLAERYGIDWEKAEEAERLMELVGGHPALIHTALYHLERGDVTVGRLLENAHTDEGIYNHHLRRHKITLQENSELFNALDIVINADDPVELDRILSYKLSSMGLVKLTGNRVTFGNELYRRFFRNYSSHFPQKF